MAAAAGDITLDDLIDKASDEKTRPKTNKEMTADFDTLLRILPKRPSDEEESKVGKLFALWSPLRNTSGGSLFAGSGAVTKANMVKLATMLGVDKVGQWSAIKNRIQTVDDPLSELEGGEAEEVKKPAPPVPETSPGGDIPGLERQGAVKDESRGSLLWINLRLNGAMKRVGSKRANEIKIATDALFRILNIGVDPSKPGRGGKSILGFALPETHLPGYNFCGPGTDVMGNLLAGRKPINKLDEACMEHDLKYLLIGTILDKTRRKKAVQAADAELIEESRLIASGPKSSLQEDATKVNGAMRIKALSGVSDFFLDLEAPKLEGDRRAAVENLFLSLAREGSDIAGNPERLEEVLPIVKPLGAAADPAPDAPTEAADAPTEAADEKKGDEEPTPGGVADGGASVSETAPVLPPEAAAAVAATIPQPQAPPRAAVQPVDEQGRATLPGAGAPPIVGERSMRPMAFRMEGDEVDLTDEQKRQNQLWLENFTWIDEGHGLGNQERLPWNLGGGKAKNSLFTAQQVNELIRLSGDLYNGDQEIREVPQVSKRTREIYRQPMISTNMRQQEFVRNGAMPAGRGRPIQMYRRTQTTPFAFRNARQTHLIHPDVVDGKRI